MKHFACEINDCIHPAICCIGYNRSLSMQRLLDSIGCAYIPYDDVTLIVSIDESDKSDEVETVARGFVWTHGEKVIRRYEKRQGVINHTLQCGNLTNIYGAIIYLEDDIVVAPGFYCYTVAALKYYQNEKEVFGIGLYSQEWLSTYECKFVPAYNGVDVYFYNGDVSWGQCWIKEQWNKFIEWYEIRRDKFKFDDKKIPYAVQRWGQQSWSRYVCIYMIENYKFYAVPYYSYTTCMSEGGVHTATSSDSLQVRMAEAKDREFVFRDFMDCIKYDAYFDRMDAFILTVCGIPFKDICIDLNGAKHDWSGYKYLLSVKELDYEKVYSFGINYVPIEMNIMLHNTGTGINLYKIDDEKNPWQKEKRYISIERIYHDIGRYSLKTLITVLKKKIKNRFRS